MTTMNVTISMTMTQVVLAAGYGSSKDISVYSRFPIQFFFKSLSGTKSA